MSIVGPEDRTEEAALVVRYARPEFVLIEENGKEQVLPVETGGTFQTESPVRQAALRPKEEARRFALGTRLLLEPSDVKYIFWTLNKCVAELKSRVIAKLQEMGVPLKIRNSRLG
jgi:hypothetical protein